MKYSLSLARGSQLRRALITGSTGFVGSNLVRHLTAAGWQVHVLVRRLDGVASALDDSQVHSYSGSLDDVVAAVHQSSPDVVFHVASLFLAQHAADQVGPLIESNVLLGAHLLEAMSLQGASRFVNTGTSWQYFEATSYNPVNLYAATKQAFEDILKYYCVARGIRAITLNLFDTYGPGDTRRKLIKLLLDASLTGVPLNMSPGEQVLDLVHVDDVCAAYLHAADMLALDEHNSAGSYAVGTGKPRTLRELVGVLEQVLGRELPIVWGARPYRNREVMSVWSGPHLPGWQAKIPIHDGFTALIKEAESQKAKSVNEQD